MEGYIEMLTATQRDWDNKTLDYDLSRYDWPAWALGVIQEIAPQVKELETMHEMLSPVEIVRVSQHVQNACSRIDFMQKFDAFAAEYVPGRVANKRYLIQRQGTLRVVIPQQAQVGRRLQFHQGIFVGNGRGCRTIWTPFTEAKGTNTMWMVDLDISRSITKQFLAEQWTLEHFENECLKHAWPVTLRPGQSHLFFQEHLHGNVNNQEGYTRVSMDMRVLVEGEEWGRRLPGGFMRLPGDYEVSNVDNNTGRRFITYAGWNTAFSKNIPLPMQRATIEAYCQKHKISYNDYQFENEHTDWLPSLEHFIREKPDGIVLCSMYSLPDQQHRRTELLQLALDLGVELHFANELCSLKSLSDLHKLETYLNFAVAKSGPYVWEDA
jgi:sporadic carbohydrate cluster protein (TIGR04323 family)